MPSDCATNFASSFISSTLHADAASVASVELSASSSSLQKSHTFSSSNCLALTSISGTSRMHASIIEFSDEFNSHSASSSSVVNTYCGASRTDFCTSTHHLCPTCTTAVWYFFSSSSH